MFMKSYSNFKYLKKKSKTYFCFLKLDKDF